MEQTTNEPKNATSTTAEVDTTQLDSLKKTVRRVCLKALEPLENFTRAIAHGSRNNHFRIFSLMNGGKKYEFTRFIKPLVVPGVSIDSLIYVHVMNVSYTEDNMEAGHMEMVPVSVTYTQALRFRPHGLYPNINRLFEVSAGYDVSYIDGQVGFEQTTLGFQRWLGNEKWGVSLSEEGRQRLSDITVNHLLPEIDPRYLTHDHMHDPYYYFSRLFEHRLITRFDPNPSGE